MKLGDLTVLARVQLSVWFEYTRTCSFVWTLQRVVHFASQQEIPHNKILLIMYHCNPLVLAASMVCTNHVFIECLYHLLRPLLLILLYLESHSTRNVERQRTDILIWM